MRKYKAQNIRKSVHHVFNSDKACRHLFCVLCFPLPYRLMCSVDFVEVRRWGFQVKVFSLAWLFPTAPTLGRK